MKDGCGSLIPPYGPNVEPLLITTPYTGAAALWGRSVALSVTACGVEPISYQWCKDGVALISATASSYSLPTVGLADAGYYSVVVTNELKCLTNSGQLVVKPADVELRVKSGAYAGINVTGVVGYTYQMQSTADLGTTNSWLTLTNLTLQQPVELWLDTGFNAATNPRRFYRVLPAP